VATKVLGNGTALLPSGALVRQDEMPKLSILLPVRNEGVNLRIMLRMLSAALTVPHEILVIHDTADDDTIPVARAVQRTLPHVRLVHNELGRGVVNAIRAGVSAAIGDYVLIFAVDEVGPVLAIEDMLHLLDEGCDFISCTRYAHGGRRLGGSRIGGLLSRTANTFLHWVGGCVLSDASTGIKMFRREVFQQLGLESKPVGWVVALEMSLKAQLRGFKLGEVPIVSIDRLYGGKSTFRLGSWSLAYFRWLLWGCWMLRTTPGRTKHLAVRLPHP
jgi:glycosyltransferase involved in cell wall biosynthesis